VAVLGEGCDGLTIITLRLGVDGSLTPWAQVPAGAKSATAIKTNRFMRYLPSENVGEAITVPSRLLGSSLPRHCDQLAVPPDPLRRRPARQRARRQVPDGCRS
jgi:hypothetical protein